MADSLRRHGSELRREWGAMSLYHCQDHPHGVGCVHIHSLKVQPQMVAADALGVQDLPFGLSASPGNYTELTLTLGWEEPAMFWDGLPFPQDC